ncbi:hypothetical protein [Burkholderia sp. Ac-20365]|uniref:hypothetical protein n=1 Tax=Burkholderia sp. Ac-20365 TaxID=2703897 RepID=UPI00197B6CA7|nr:hypothetical protein [Burkholderia sp. Ac-20365]MBN3759315.1 hypothetical protein [Burkholderia sp. Ac-20365]
MPKVTSSSPSHVAAPPTTSTSQPNTPSTTTGVKRRASSPPPGMPPSAKQMKTAAATSHAPADWHTEATRFGISGSGIAQTQGGKSDALETHGRAALRDPSVSPTGALAAAKPDDLIKKTAAPKAGDHSPSISSVNRTQADEAKVLGRGAANMPGAFNIGERNVPTLQFTNDRFKTANDKHATQADSAAHSAFTSLREMHGVGEQSAHANMDSLLDATARAYSPYNAQGEPSRGSVELPKTNVHAQNVGGASLHKSKAGVDPMIGQQMMNMWYRQNIAGKPMLDELIRTRQQNAPAPVSNRDDDMDTSS